MKNQFNKRWKAKLYMFYLKIKNKIIHRNITYEAYTINHTIPQNTYDVIECLITPDIQKKFDKSFQDELNKHIINNIK